MISPNRRPDSGRRAGPWWATAIVLLILALGCFATVLRDSTREASDRAALPSAQAPARRPALDTTPGAQRAGLARSVPVVLSIPAIGLDLPLTQLGLNADRTVQVPSDPRQPGWYRLGPTPGELGSAVILGHVDSYRGPAVFYRLHSLRPGDQVAVTRADGTVARFAVQAVATYPKTHFPARQVYGSHGYSALQLVTCGGKFDSKAHSYRSNVVVYTSLVRPAPAEAPSPTSTGADGPVRRRTV
jgi:hypothetical protein